MKDVPEKLKPYASLGLELRPGDSHSTADCPFCGRAGKFSLNNETGQWRCFVCDAGDPGPRGASGGNVYTFLRLFWELAKSQTQEVDYESLRDHRGLLSTQTVEDWGCVVSPITGEWLLPGCGADGALNTLYRYVPQGDGGDLFKLYALAGMPHQLYGPPLYDRSKKTVYLCEGPWDAMALYEILRQTKKDVQGYTLTGAVPSSLYAKANVLALPSCSTFNPAWLPLFEGCKVVLCFDNDHPREHPKTGEPVAPAALEGSKRVAGALASSAEHKPESIHWLAWGPEGYDPDLPSGTDVRDVLREAPAVRDRVKRLWWMLEKIEPIPADWLGGRTPEAEAEGGTTLSLLPCHTWRELKGAWEQALEWHEGLDRALAVMLSVVLSTRAGGDQLWAMVIGPPACGKSTLCEAISTAVRWVTAKSTIRGFHSGYKTDMAGKEDHSLIPLIADKTLVTKDGDTLLQSPNLGQILAEARDLYDRTSRSHYRHGLKRDYQGINMTWVLCGTGALSEIDRSELGQRFIKVIIMDKIDDQMEWKILLRHAKKQDQAMDQETDGKPEHSQHPTLTRAYRLTGGYVEYLRGSSADLLKEIELSDDVYEQCALLARFVAYLRARPSKLQKETAEREFGTRLTSQFVRLAKCLCVVHNEPSPTPEIMQIVRQTALDTARGRVFKLTGLLYEAGAKGCDARALAHIMGEVDQDVKELLVFLKKINAVELFTPKIAPLLLGEPRWRLTNSFWFVYEAVMMGDESNTQEEERRAAAQDETE